MSIFVPEAMGSSYGQNVVVLDVRGTAHSTCSCLLLRAIILKSHVLTVHSPVYFQFQVYAILVLDTGIWRLCQSVSYCAAVTRCGE